MNREKKQRKRDSECMEKVKVVFRRELRRSLRRMETWVWRKGGGFWVWWKEWQSRMGWMWAVFSHVPLVRHRNEGPVAVQSTDR